MFAPIVLLTFFIGLAVAGLRGWTADSRDVNYRLWPSPPCRRCSRAHDVGFDRKEMGMPALRTPEPPVGSAAGRISPDAVSPPPAGRPGGPQLWDASGRAVAAKQLSRWTTDGGALHRDD